MSRNPYTSFISLYGLQFQIEAKIQKRDTVRQELHERKVLLAGREGLLVATQEKMRFIGGLVEFGFTGNIAFVQEMTPQAITDFIETYNFQGQVVSPSEIIGGN